MRDMDMIKLDCWLKVLSTSRYKVAWVRAWRKTRKVSVQGTDVEVPVVKVHEGPRIFTNTLTQLAPWEGNLEIPHPEFGQERTFELPGANSQFGGARLSYVVSAEWGTRTVEINTEGNTHLRVRVR